MSISHLSAILNVLFNPQVRDLLAYYESQIRFLENHMPRRPRPTLADRLDLSSAAFNLGRKNLARALNLFQPETLLRWHRDLIRKKWDYSRLRKGPGRPGKPSGFVLVLLQMAQDNPSWGYSRLQGVLAELGLQASRQTVKNILRKHGFQPSPERHRGMSWGQFLRTHWDAMVATDFFTWEVLTPFGLATYYVLFFIRLKTREIHIAGLTLHPNQAWMTQIARHLTMEGLGWLKTGQILLHDRGGQYCPAFRNILNSQGIKTVMLPFMSPNLNAYAERWVRSVKEECLSKVICLNEEMLRTTLREYCLHYHHERPHQGLGNIIPFPRAGPTHGPPESQSQVLRSSRLGGLLNHYSRKCG